MSIRKIAKLAEVSTSTVSRVINNHPYVSEELRARVLDVMAEIDYVPNQNAVNLSKGESQVIGLVVPYIRNSCYDQLVEGILEEATKQKKKVMLLPTYFNKELEAEYYTLLRDKTVDGIIVTSKTHDDQFLKELNQFGSIVTTEKTTIESIPSVYPNRVEMYKKVFSYIKNSTDVEDIYITVNRGKEQSLSTQLKMTVFEEYFPNHSLESVFINSMFNYEDGYTFGQTVFSSLNKPVVIYCNGDEIAAGIFQAAKEANLDMKKDFFLIGEDNQLFSHMLGIDSVDFNLKKVGKKAVQHLINKTDTHHVIEGEFIRRT